MSAAMDSAQGTPQQGRARAKSNAFSFHSQGSGDNSSKTPKTPKSPKSPKNKHGRKESETKTHYDVNTKANPNAAMNEAQPSTCPEAWML